MAPKQWLTRVALCVCGSRQNRSNYLGPTNTTLRVKSRNELILNVNIRLFPRVHMHVFSVISFSISLLSAEVSFLNLHKVLLHYRYAFIILSQFYFLGIKKDEPTKRTHHLDKKSISEHR